MHLKELLCSKSMHKFKLNYKQHVPRPFSNCFGYYVALLLVGGAWQIGSIFKLAFLPLGQGFTNLFCKRPDRRYFGLCKLDCLCHYSALSF